MAPHSLQRWTVSDSIFEWRSDGSSQGPGFKLCVMGTETPTSPPTLGEGETHTPSNPPTEMPTEQAFGFVVLSGGAFCEVDADGCVHDGAGPYGTNEECTLEFRGDATIGRVEWGLESSSSCSYDW